MFAHVIETATPSLIVLLTGSLVIAGLVKGVIGVRMPIVAFPMLSMLVDVQTAVMLLSMPLVLSNIPQALEGGLVAQTLLSLAPVLVGMIPGVWIGVAVLLNVDPAVAKMAAGASVILVAALTLLAPKLQIKRRMIGPVGLGAGFCGGLLGGIAALAGPPVLIFLLSRFLSWPGCWSVKKSATPFPPTPSRHWLSSWCSFQGRNSSGKACSPDAIGTPATPTAGDTS